MKPYNFQWTRFYEDNAEFKNTYPGFDIELIDTELFICSTIVGPDNFSILTTRRLITKDNGDLQTGMLAGACGKGHGDFKGVMRKEATTFGTILLENGSSMKYVIETGKASMIMIYGVDTAIGKLRRQ